MSDQKCQSVLRYDPQLTHKDTPFVQDHATKTADELGADGTASSKPPSLEKSTGLSALDKATLVLEAIVAYPRPIGLPDLTADLGLPRQTIHRVLQQLCDNGLIIRDPSRDRYAVGPRLSRLAMATLNSDNHRAPLRAILTDVVAGRRRNL